jgi:hypothetical protein
MNPELTHTRIFFGCFCQLFRDSTPSLARFHHHVLLMTGLPLAMVNTDGFAFASYATTIQAHLVAMFLPGVGSGYCADRWGSLPILLVGGVVVAGAIAFGRDGNQLWNFTACLTAVGAGWNFLAVGSTKLLLASHTKEEAAPIEVSVFVLYSTSFRCWFLIF